MTMMTEASEMCKRNAILDEAESNTRQKKQEFLGLRFYSKTIIIIIILREVKNKNIKETYVIH